MRAFFGFGLLFILISCGGGGGSGSHTPAPQEEQQCSVSFYESDNLEILVMKANEARVKCGLSEEEIVNLTAFTLKELGSN